VSKDKVIILLCDTLRAKSLPHYGCTNLTIPNISKIIDDEFITYSRAYAPAPWTTPSHLSLFTGLYPSQVMEKPTSFTLDPIFRTLPELFKDSGYRTYASSANTLIARKFGFDKGFDYFMQCWLPHPEMDEVQLSLKGRNRFEKIVSLISMLLNPDHRNRTCRGLVEKLYLSRNNILKDSTASTDRSMKLLSRFISDNQHQKLFCFVNLMQTHDRYNPPAVTRYRFGEKDTAIEDEYKNTTPLDHYALGAFSRDLINYTKLRYEEEVLYLDIVIRDFIDLLKNNNLYDETTIIITSDHGEHFGENGHIAHAFSVFEPLIRIPLYIKWSGSVENRDRVNTDLVMLHDLYSTFITYTDHWHPPPFSSVDFFSSDRRPFVFSQLQDMKPNINGCRKKRQSFSVNELGLKEGSLNAFVFDNGKKIIENRGAKFCYDLNIDPDESEALPSSPEDAEKIEGILNIIE
jgi:arylsulfatase A-like enzyme